MMKYHCMHVTHYAKPMAKCQILHFIPQPSPSQLCQSLIMINVKNNHTISHYCLYTHTNQHPNLMHRQQWLSQEKNSIWTFCQSKVYRQYFTSVKIQKNNTRILKENPYTKDRHTTYFLLWSIFFWKIHQFCQYIH